LLVRELRCGGSLANVSGGGLDVANEVKNEPGGAAIASGQGGAPDAPKATDALEAGKVHRTRTERRIRERRTSERRQLMEDPNLNQAGNDRGSADQMQGSQTANDVDPIPE
jgi:hypothetical protein